LVSALIVIPGVYAVAKLQPDAPVPVWAAGGNFVSVTRTAHELSIVCEQASVPSNITIEGGWRALMVAGPLDFDLTGILASLTAPLSVAGISVFAIATYDTDYLLIRVRDLPRAANVLREAGHTVSGDLSAARHSPKFDR
jgi:hypothetical protein